jgi:broad specificity phosphatase PhoE
MIERLLFARHGETLHNTTGVAQGWSDSELTDVGWRQAHLLAMRVRDFAPTSLFCSSLPRAVATARVIAAELGLDPVPLDDLREMNCGEWEGRAFVDVRSHERERYEAWMSDPAVACPGGESFADVAVRLERALDTIRDAERNGGGRPLIVSHGLAIRIAAATLLGIPLASARKLAQDNAALNIFDARGGQFILRLWNDTTHCQGAGAE